MTRRDLTLEEEEHIPVYIDTHFVEDGLYFAYWGNQGVWSEEKKLPWYFDKDNEEIQTQDFEEQFPGYSQLTDVLASKKALTAKYKGSDVRWSFKKEQWRYNNHKPVNFKEMKTLKKNPQNQKMNKCHETTVRGLV